MQRSKAAILGAALVVAAVAVWRFGKPARVPEHAAGAVASSASKPAAPTLSKDPVATAQPSAALKTVTPPLPDGAPKRVSVGVVLFAYRGAEGAPADARPKAEALDKAKALLAEAQNDFGEAVKKGDRGSRADLGHIPRGVLEADLEYALFTLKKGEVAAAPLDTPKGYWIVRRNE